MLWSCTIWYHVGGQEELLAKLQAGQQIASPSGCAATAYGTVQRKRHCQALMPTVADAKHRQVRQRLAHARRHPLQASASELTRLQHQVQGMHKHMKRNYLKANSAKLEAACRAGRQSFWTPFKIWTQSRCPVDAQAQLVYMQELHGAVPAPALRATCLQESRT